MPIQIKDLSKGIRSVKVEYQGESCMIQYRAGANTAAAAIEMQERIDNEEVGLTEALVERLVELIEEWDLMDGDKVAPITKEVLASLPMSFLTEILRAINEEQSPQTRRSRR